MSESSSLIIGKEKIKWKIFKRCIYPEPGTAAVLYKEGQPMLTLFPSEQLPDNEINISNYSVLYKVDISEHLFSFDCKMPCKGDIFEFQLSVDITYSVKSPDIIIQKNITDVPSIIKSFFSNMRIISREFEPEQSAEAENAIRNKFIQEFKEINIGLGIDRLTVKLILEDDAKNHLRQLKEVDRKKDYEKKLAELDVYRIKLEIELKKRKMEFYGPMIKEGQWHLLALQLSEHPEDVASILRVISENRQAELENQLKALKIMLDENVIEGFQMEEASKRVLQSFIKSFEPELKTIGLNDIKKNPTEAQQQMKDSQQ